MTLYTRKKAEGITGIPARRIQFYTDSGLINLDQRNPGRGNERGYSKDNLLELLLIKELSKYRIELSTIKRIMGDFGQKMSFLLKIPNAEFYLSIRDDEEKGLIIDEHDPFKLWINRPWKGASELIVDVGRLARKLESI